MSTTTNYFSQSQNPQNVKPSSEQQTGYVQQAADLFSSATATVSSYLPTGLTNATATVAQNVQPDPAKQYRNKQLHVGGVGDLGTDSVEDVARLPEERQHPDPFSMTDITGVVGHPGSAGGVGDLGTPSTTDGVSLPEERANPDPFLSQNKTDSYGVGGHPGFPGGVGDLGATTTEGVAVLEERGRHAGRDYGHTGANDDLDHGLGMPHTRSADPASQKADETMDDIPTDSSPMRSIDSEVHGSDQQTMASAERTSADKTSGEYQSPKEANYPTGKPSLMDKVKGTAIIAKAKLGTTDQEKLHQGQMLKETGKKINLEEEARKAGNTV